MRTAVTSGSSVSPTAQFHTHWLVYGSGGDTGLSAGLAAERTAGMASGLYSQDGCRIFYERQSAFLTFLYYQQNHPNLPVVSDAWQWPASPIVLQYAYLADLTFMSLMHTYAPSMCQANPAYGSGPSQSLTNPQYTITGQGPVVMAAFEALTGLDFVDTIVKPTLAAFFAGPSQQTTATVNLPTDFTGVVDFDYETWYPDTRWYTTPTTSLASGWFDNASEYFLRWCRTGSKADGWVDTRDLPAEHFDYCPQISGSPHDTDAAAIALFWDVTLRYWQGIKEAMRTRAPASKLQIYGYPRTPTYYEYAYYLPTPAYEQVAANQAAAEAALNLHYAKYTDPAAEGMVVALLDVHAPSWYYGYGTTLAAGADATVTYPWSTYPNEWSHYQHGKLLYSYTRNARRIADFYGKPLVPYITCVTSTMDNPGTSPANEADLYGPAVTAETAKMFGRFIAGCGVDGLNLWGYYSNTEGNTSAELLAGLANVKDYIITPCRATRVPFASTPSYNWPPPPVAAP